MKLILAALIFFPIYAFALDPATQMQLDSDVRFNMDMIRINQEFDRERDRRFEDWHREIDRKFEEKDRQHRRDMEDMYRR